MLRITLIASFCYLVSADTQCTSQEGQCLDWRWYKCTAGYETGLCSGDSNRQCCLPCNSACAITEQNYDDSACESINGECWDNSNYCAGSYKSGYCGGSSARQCCTSSSGSCDMVSYSTQYIKGYNGLDVRVQNGFVGAMDTLNTYARQCGVTVWVTHAFRYEGQTIGGAVVPPASSSNHLVGHAIDFNVDTPNGWCNSDCLYGGYNSYAECFIQKVLNNGDLRWGGVWSPSDPVHIDDGLNVYHKSEWDALYYDLQGNC